MRVNVHMELELDEDNVCERLELYMNLFTHKLKVETGKAGALTLKRIYWERETVNGRTVAPNGEIICSD